MLSNLVGFNPQLLISSWSQKWAPLQTLNVVKKTWKIQAFYSQEVLTELLLTPWRQKAAELFLLIFIKDFEKGTGLKSGILLLREITKDTIKAWDVLENAIDTVAMTEVTRTSIWSNWQPSTLLTVGSSSQMEVYRCPLWTNFPVINSKWSSKCVVLLKRCRDTTLVLGSVSGLKMI